jgi:hypothetical protein
MKFVYSGNAKSPTFEEIASVIKSFEEEGESGPHTPEGWMLAPLLSYCYKNWVPFTLAYIPTHGFYVKKGKVDGVIPPEMQAWIDETSGQ